MPRARQDAALQPAFAQRALEVEAVALRGVETAVAVRERDLVVSHTDGVQRPGRDVIHPSHRDELASTHRRATLAGSSCAESVNGCTLTHVATILLCGVDVFFRGKLEALLPGHHLVTTDSADWPDLVIADIARIDPDEVVDAYPDVPILGFGGHTDTAGLRRAHAAGFDQVLVKNALQERVAEVVEELTAPVE
jgi:hypothetical protein